MPYRVKRCWKSTKQQNSLPLFSLLTYLSIRVLIKIKIWSVVRYPRRKPIWEECKIFLSWKYTLNLVFRIEKNNFPKQLVTQMPLYFEGSDLFPDMKIWVIMPVNQLSGKVPFDTMKLKSFTKGALKWLIPLFDWHFVSNFIKTRCFLILQQFNGFPKLWFSNGFIHCIWL